MNKIDLSYINWDKIYCTYSELSSFTVGTKVVAQFEWGTELARVVAISKVNTKDVDCEEVSLLHEATTEDIKEQTELFLNSKEALEYCHDQSRQLKLNMKLVDAHFSLDKKRLVFAFIAQGRVDFRELLKDITKKYRGSIRLQQIGVRDEAKISGDLGPCGYGLCCRTHLASIGNVSSEMAESQKISQRGSERLSGICGRLKCCLAYENSLNKNKADNN
jgi:cell fate regulator YaaT (PSP1 superfamily)